MLVSTGVIVARHAPPIVRTTSVTQRVDRVLNLNLDGLERIVTRVGVDIRGVYSSFAGKPESLRLHRSASC